MSGGDEYCIFRVGFGIKKKSVGHRVMNDLASTAQGRDRDSYSWHLDSL